MSFDISHEEGIKIICDEIRAKYPDYKVIVVADIDITD